MSNRKINVDIIPHCGVYVTITMRIPDCTETEKSLMMEKAKNFFETAQEFEGEPYDLPFHTNMDLGEVVIHNTFVFPNEHLAQEYVDSISHIA